MALPTVQKPLHIIDQEAWALTRGVHAALDTARASIQVDKSVANAAKQTGKLKPMIEPIAAMLATGELDAWPARKAELQAVLAELTALATSVGPLSPKYGAIVSAEKATRNGNGDDVTYEALQAEIQMSADDVTAIVAAITTALGS